MYKTHVRPSADLRANYNEISKIANESDQVIITKNGRLDTVVIGVEAFREYEEYLREKYVLERLDKAIKSLDNPNTEFVPHDEVWAKLEAKWGGK